MKRHASVNGFVFCSFVALLALSAAGCGLAETQEQWWAEGPPQDAGAASAILGSDVSAWKVTDRSQEPARHSISRLDGRPVLISEQPVVLHGRTYYDVDTELTLSFRVRPESSGGGSLAFVAGIKGVSAPLSEGLRIGVDITPDSVSGSTPGGRFSYVVKSMPRSLNWPDGMRKRVEHQFASVPPATQTWHRLRCILRENRWQVYLDDRMVVDKRGEDVDAAGMVRIELPAQMALASFRARKATWNPLYEPVDLSGYVNASKIDGAVLSRPSLPEAGQAVLVNGIPFVFAEPGADGNDHIDLGKSWLQQGSLAGYFQAQTGPFGGRWTGTVRLNPARIQLRIPNDRYRSIRLIASADGDEDTVPVVTAQFYRPSCGFPKQFSAQVPLFAAPASDVTPLPVGQGGGRGNLYLVTIPLDAGELSTFSDLDIIEMELTKQVQLYRGYPDPFVYSYHQAGLPSGVHIYAMTMERYPVDMVFEPDKFGNVWTAPAVPSYTVKLRNRTGEPRAVQLELTSVSHDGTEHTAQKQELTVPAGGKGVEAKFSLALKRYGHHDVGLTMRDGERAWTERRSLARLHPDTREKQDWERGKGPLFGVWMWCGGHNTPKGMLEPLLLGEAGAQSRMSPFSGFSEEEIAVLATYGYRWHGAHGSAHWLTNPGGPWKFDPARPEESGADLVERIKNEGVKPDAVHKPRYFWFFAEPGIGDMTLHGTLPSYYGEPQWEVDEAHQEAFQMYLQRFLVGAAAIKKEWPEMKILLPWGEPLFAVPFLRSGKIPKDLIDGTVFDCPFFEHQPEHQFHQLALHRLYMVREEWRKFGKDPVMPVMEGPFLPTEPGALSLQQQADYLHRYALMMLAYGVDEQIGGPLGADCLSYYGEQHYGGNGYFTRLPVVLPKPAYAAFATWTRHLNRMNFSKWIPTGSLTAYCLQYKHYQTGRLTHALWTVRGKRPVTLTVPEGTTLSLFDQNDNVTVLTEMDGTVTFTLTTSPRYVEELAEDAQVTLGEPDHSDTAPAAGAIRMGNLGDGTWDVSAEPDPVYADNTKWCIVRFPGRMSVRAVDAPEEKGGKALAVHLGEQERQQKIMPYYTTLMPARPMTIPGKASHIGMWVKAASDWGRVVYSLRDAKGERWVSVGTKDQWNCDDTHNWSYFCFDGWRYLRFELPASSPYDSFRELGTTWWGTVDGDGIVDLPLRLEKIIVERRAHAMYVNDPQPTRPDDVLLADLYAEYGRPEDATAEAIRLSRLRMPVPEGMPGLSNPIAELAEAGVAPPTTVEKVTAPTHQYDGTRCHVHFRAVEGAQSYDVWVSPYPDGRGALKLGSAWKEPGGLILGLRPDTDFYVFVAYTDDDGKPSEPSEPLKIHLQDLFARK